MNSKEKLLKRNLWCFTSMSNTPCTANAVNILLNVSWHVKVYHVAYIGNVQATSSNLYKQKIFGSVICGHRENKGLTQVSFQS